jgi:hypothetical protein
VGKPINKLILAVFSASLAPGVSTAEVLGPLLPPHTLEVGVMERNVNRILEPEVGEPLVFDQYDYPVTLRYGVTANATVSFELSGDPNSLFFEADVVQYTVGAGISTLLWAHDEFALATGIHYYRRLDVQGKAGWADYLTQGIDWDMLGQQAFRIGRVDGFIWGGPTISYLIVEPQAPWPEDSALPDQVLGGVVGLTLLSRIGIVLQGSFVWIDEPEYRLNLGFRF